MSRTPDMRYAMPNKWLEQQGPLSLKQLWIALDPLRGTAVCGAACAVLWGLGGATRPATRFGPLSAHWTTSCHGSLLATFIQVSPSKSKTSPPTNTSVLLKLLMVLGLASGSATRHMTM